MVGPAPAADETPAGGAEAAGPRPGLVLRRALMAGGALVAVLAAGAGAFLAWGPVGLGPGPLAVASVSADGSIPATGRTVLVIPVGAAGPAAPVIDSVSLRGRGKYGAPGMFSVLGTASQDCAGIWVPAAGAPSFGQRCAPGGTAPVTGRVLPRRGGARGTDLALEVGPPGTSGCWAVGQVTIRYHVGHRHYTVTEAESLFGCTSA